MALDNYKVARPYAKAIFEHAFEKNILSEWQQIFIVFQFLMKDKAVYNVINHPKLSFSEKVGFFESFDFPKAAHDSLHQFLTELVMNKRLATLAEIAELFLELYQTHQNKVHVEVLSSVKLNDLQLEKLKQALTQRFHNKKIEINNEVKPSLLGGLIIKAENIIIDLSVSTQLKTMVNQLIP